MGDPIPMVLHCPECMFRHVDAGEFATKPHHTHSCQKCGLTWRPSVVPTVGVRFLPGFKDEEKPDQRDARIAELEAALTGLLDAMEKCQAVVDPPYCGRVATHSTSWTDHEVDRCEEHSKGAERCSIADAVEQAERVTGRRP